MTDDNKQQPYRPPHRAANRYRQFGQMITQPHKHELSTDRKKLFTLTITGTATLKGDAMDEQLDEQRFLIDLLFKPNESGLKLWTAETQLLLSYIGEILKEIEDEENTPENASKNKGATPCK